MSEPRREFVPPTWPPRGVAVAIVPAAMIEQHWDSVEQLLRILENHTQLVSATDIRGTVLTGTMRAWGASQWLIRLLSNQVKLLQSTFAPCKR